MKTSFLILLVFLFAQNSFANDKFSHKGSFWSRHEARDDALDAQGDKNLTFTRFNLLAQFQANPETLIVFHPQFSRVWGAKVDDKTASGGVTDQDLGVHEAFVKRNFADNYDLIVGRKELNFGDQLLVGGVGWHYIGRSFDLTELNYHFDEANELKFFYSNVVENALDVAAKQDFSGAYFAGSNQFLNELDVYLLNKTLQQDEGLDNISTYGARVVKRIAHFQIKAEQAFQEGRMVDNETASGEYLTNLELLASFESINLVTFLGYNAASKDFDQLFPTGHKWLGFADQFSRRNISSYILGADYSFNQVASLSLTHHLFSRVDTDAPAYRFGGSAYGNVGDEKDIASETDLVLKYKIDKNLLVLGGYSLVSPQAYLKDQGIDDPAHWAFAQLKVSF